MFHKCKPETLEKHRKAREYERQQRKIARIAELHRIAARDRSLGIPDSENIWLELLQEPCNQLPTVID